LARLLAAWPLLLLLLAVVVVVVIVTNALVGFFQEFRAEKTMAALQWMSSPSARVICDGVQVTVATWDVVSGDILLVEMGGVVGADARLIDVLNLEIDEALLTGESVSVVKG
jgi:P-type Na+/K+ transporter